jgi:hypothetical protein
MRRDALSSVEHETNYKIVKIFPTVHYGGSDFTSMCIGSGLKNVVSTPIFASKRSARN